MASYHLSAKAGKVGSGAAHADYIARIGRYASKSKDDLEHAESGNLPDWASGDPRAFWEAADLYERKNGYVYREFEVALPRELDPEQRLALVREFIEKELPNHTYTFAIHNPKAAIDGGEQPHAHIMYSERIQDGIQRTAETHFKRANKKSPELGGCAKISRFACGKTTTEAREALKEIRGYWANLQNRYLEEHGHEARVDHRTLKEQGIDPAVRVPESKLGPKYAAVYGKELAARRRGVVSKAPEWKDYIAARKGHFAEKTADRQAQLEQFEKERKELQMQHKARREELKRGEWKGERDVLTARRSVIAAEQAAEKAALRERHQQEREKHRQQFRPFPQFEQWKKTQEIEVPAEPQRIEGDRSEPPTPRDIRAYVPEVVGQQVNYARRDGGGVRGAAFVDKGKAIDIHDWREADTTLAALQLAAQKWGKITVNGNAEYKAMIATLAAEHGFKIANPEMQEAIQQERTRLYEERQQARKAEQDAAIEKPAIEPAAVVDETELRKEAEEWGRKWNLRTERDQKEIEAYDPENPPKFPEPSDEQNFRAWEEHHKNGRPADQIQSFGKIKYFDQQAGKVDAAPIRDVILSKGNHPDERVSSIELELTKERKKNFLMRDGERVRDLEKRADMAAKTHAHFEHARKLYEQFAKERLEKLRQEWAKRQEDIKKQASELKKYLPMAEAIRAERKAQREAQPVKQRQPEKERGMSR
jgi:hypothetical protein